MAEDTAGLGDEIWIVVPVKGFAVAKARLAPSLSREDRSTLARAMAERTMAAVASSGVSHAYVVSDDEEVGAMAEALGLELLPDEGQDHSSAMRAVGRRASEAGIAALVTLAADLPLVTPDDVNALAAAAKPNTMVIAPDQAGTGTNAIVASPPTFPFSFGPGSRERHITIARGLGLTVRVLERRGLAIDIDCPEDLSRLPGPIVASALTPELAAASHGLTDNE